MSRHESISPRQKDTSISIGFLAAVIPFATSILIGEVLFRAPKGQSLKARHLAGSISRFTDKEPIPTDPETNGVTFPSGAIGSINVGERRYFVNDFSRKGARIKFGGKIEKHRAKNPEVFTFHMKGGEAVDLGKYKKTHIFDDGTVAVWRP